MTASEGAGNLADLLRAAGRSYPDRPALFSQGGVRTWGELDAAADAGAAALHGTGIPVGARVLVALPTGSDLALVLFAIARAGLVSVPIDPARTDAALIAGRVQADIGISTTSSHGREMAFLPSDLAGWWATGGGSAAGQHAGSEAPVATGGEDLAVIARASHGDKAVMLSHRAVLAAVDAILQAGRLGLNATDRVLLALPLFHLAGFVTAFLPLARVGGAAVVPAAGDVVAALEAVKVHRVTIMPGAPGLYHELRSIPGADRSLASVRLMTSGAAPLDPADFAGIRKLTGQPVWEGYGISESSSVVCSSLMTPGARAGSVGLPLPGIEVRIVDAGDGEDGADSVGPDDEIAAEVAGSGEVGHIAVRGRTLFSGYWPDGAGGPDESGWFVTDDVGYTDDAGELHLVDRAGETITVAGFKVYPREVEEVLDQHPYVAEAAVVGVPGPAGQRVVAVLAARPGTHPTEDDLSEFVAENLPTFKRPTVFHLMAALPRTELGRLDRVAARQLYAEAVGIDLTDGPAPSSPLSAVRPDPAVPDRDRPDDGSAGPDPAGPSDQSDAEATDAGPSEDPDFAPEPVADLHQLGARLPGTGTRIRRGARDTDEDLFGDEVL